MEYWLIIILVALVVLAISGLLYFEVMGDSSLRLRQNNKAGSEYVNHQSAMICHTIKATADDSKAYVLFVEYLFSNIKLFLLYVKNTYASISQYYYSQDFDSLENIRSSIKMMGEELEAQKQSQDDCLNSIDPVFYIESHAWINLSSSCMLEINKNLKNLDEVCIQYLNRFTEQFPELYTEQLEALSGDICNFCDQILELVGSGNIEKMRDVRKDISLVLSESYANSQRLYELLHDGRNELTPDKRVVLQYVLNAFQETHCMLYSIRRLVLAILCISLSVK